MDGITFRNKRHLCYIDDTDFTAYQGIGSDPLYRRYESVLSVVKNHIDKQYQSFLAAPYYEDGLIHWYVDEWKQSPVCFKDLLGTEREKYAQIRDNTIQHYKQVLSTLSTEEYAILAGALRYISDDFIYCFDDKVVLVAWGMRPDTSKHVVEGSWIKGLKQDEKFKVTFDAGADGDLKSPIGKVINRKKGYKLTAKDIPDVVPHQGYSFAGWDVDDIIGFEVQQDTTFTAKYNKVATTQSVAEEKEEVQVSFDAGTNGILSGKDSIKCTKGHVLESNEIPFVHANEGYEFVRWVPSINKPIERDTQFIAEYSRTLAHCTFSAGEHGTIFGQAEWYKPHGSSMLSDEIPTVEADKGYEFIGWNYSPLSPLNEDCSFVAQYQEILPWYKRFRSWLMGAGCLKWLLWALLFLLIMLLFSWLLRDCGGCNRIANSTSDSVSAADNDIYREGDRTIGSIIDREGNLPKQTIISAITGENGALPPIIHNDGIPDVIANRLNIYFDDEKADLDKWAHEFKKIYPSDDYQIVGCDPNVRLIQIQIPENQRDKIREEINDKIPDQEFFVVDESIITLRGRMTTKQNEIGRGWHLQAIHAKEAWSITKGSPDVVIAIVDDGMEVTHDMLKGRCVKAYNVFTQQHSVSIGEGHGTHVGALAAGSITYYDQGASGIAPQCKIMPIQVFENKLSTFSSIASGIMYAIHNGADVVNISIGPSFSGLDQLPLEKQKEIAQTYFKNEERVYRHIIQTANKKNVILVFAAGNDNIVTAILPECRTNNQTVNVAAVSQDLKAADFTNYSVGTNISAPGVNIYSAFPKNSFKTFEGTSMAAPIVAGSIALMRSIKSDLTVEQVIGVMQQTGRSIDGGYIPPMVLVDKALEAVKNGHIANSRIDEANPDTEIVDTDVVSDDYNVLKGLLEQLKKQRMDIDKKINQIENKLRGNGKQ